MAKKLQGLTPTLSIDHEEEEIELEPQLAATIPFVTTSSTGSTTAETAIEQDLLPQSSNHLKTPVDARRSLSFTANGGMNGGGVPLRNKQKNGQAVRPKSWNGSPPSYTRTPDTRSLSIYDIAHDTSRRPSALDILSCHGSESAAGNFSS